MKTTQKLFNIVASIIICITLLFLLSSLFNNNTPKIILPENYKIQLDSTTAVIVYIDKDSVIHIEYNNSIQFKWEGLEKDIPEDKEYIQISGTVDNTVYLNAIDE